MRRLVLTGGGVRVSEWVQALADCTGLPADVVAVPEGGALGSAFFARLAAGLETDATAARRWARVDHRVEPDPAWVEPCARRYERRACRPGPRSGPDGHDAQRRQNAMTGCSMGGWR